jgi:putative transcriptional regulator
MTIRHHPSETTLISYAAGALPAAIAGLVACHATICPECRVKVRRLKIVGALLLETIEAEPPAEAEVTRAVSRFAQSNIVPLPRADRPSDPLLPAPLAHYLGMTSDEIPWKTLVKGLQQYRVRLPKGSGEIRLLKARPRLRFLRHSHRGMELTMVLKGAYRDETGEYHRGDVSDLHVDIEHQPKVMSDDECICIIASEAPARYSELLPRLLQPIMGF